jgi:hypothetical protein
LNEKYPPYPRLVDAAARILELERRLAVRERELAERLAGPPPIEPVAKRPLPAGCLARIALFGVLAFALIIVVSSVNTGCVADAIPAWVHHATGLGVFVVFAGVLMVGTKRSWRGMAALNFLIPIFVAGGVGADLPSQLNRVLDRTPRVRSTVRVLAGWSGGDRSELRLASWTHPGCTKVLVPRSKGGGWQAGEDVVVVRGRGFFGWEWVEQILPIDPSATREIE